MIVGNRVKTHTGHVGRIVSIDVDNWMVLVRHEDLDPESTVVGSAVYLNKGGSLEYWPTPFERVLDFVDGVIRRVERFMFG